MTMRPSEQATMPHTNAVATSAYGLTADQISDPLQGTRSANYTLPFEQSDEFTQQWQEKHRADWEDRSVMQANRRDNPSLSRKAERTKLSESDRDELTGLSRTKSAVTGEIANSDADPLTGSRSRAAGLPYPGRLLRYVPGQPLRFDRAALQWQTRMRERGWSVQADGFYGVESARICRQFQRAKGLSADGIVGPATWTATFRNDVVIRPQPGGISRINQRGLDLIKSFEGLSLRAYRDPVGIWTIGYGHTGPEVGPGDVITTAQAETLLRNDLTRFENGVRSLVKVPLTSNQFSALVSFAFNVGTGALTQSTLLTRLNQRDYQGAANEFSRWVYGGGQVLPGLVRRREAEKQLFLA
jgi:lysozyme